MEKTKIISNAILALGIVLASVILTSSIHHYVNSKKRITVKGLAERDVKADLVVWPMVIRELGSSLNDVQAKITNVKQEIINFLYDYGFTDEEISISYPEVTDNYRWNKTAPYRYAVRLEITLRTNKVDKVLEATANSSEVLKKGIVLSADYGSKPVFIFTKLNDIKPLMIKEATANAREVAEQFASDANNALGNLFVASQGVFQIKDRDAGSPQIKTVRIVTTLTYGLD